jgi:acyl-CoA thioester hydrolase
MVDLAPHRTEIQVRFADTDALGHLNNTSYALYAEQARLEFLRAATSERPEGFILAHIALDFRRQTRFGDAVHVLTWVAEVGSTSVTLAQQVISADAVAADIRSVIVRFDYGTQRPVRLQQDERAWLEARRR